LSKFDVNHSHWVYLAIAESMQAVEGQEIWAELRKTLKAMYFVAVGKGFEVEERPRKIGAASKEGQVVSQVGIAETVDAGAARSERVGNGLQKLGCLADIG
jgi:hypothetical protein